MLFDYNDSGTIRAYGAVGMGELNVEDFMEAFGAMDGKDVTIHLQSEGGDVIEGISILDKIQQYSGHVTIQVDTLAASIASVLMTAADVINATPMARIMVHRAWAVGLGNAPDFRNLADLLESFDHDIADQYASRAGGGRDKWMAFMEKETWFSATEAIEVGLIDGVVTAKSEPVENRAEKPVVASVSAKCGLGPAAQTMVKALKMKQRLMAEGRL